MILSASWHKLGIGKMRRSEQMRHEYKINVPHSSSGFCCLMLFFLSFCIMILCKLNLMGGGRNLFKSAVFCRINPHIKWYHESLLSDCCSRGVCTNDWWIFLPFSNRILLITDSKPESRVKNRVVHCYTYFSSGCSVVTSWRAGIGKVPNVIVVQVPCCRHASTRIRGRQSIFDRMIVVMWQCRKVCLHWRRDN